MMFVNNVGRNFDMTFSHRFAFLGPTAVAFAIHCKMDESCRFQADRVHLSIDFIRRSAKELTIKKIETLPLSSNVNHFVPISYVKCMRLFPSSFDLFVLNVKVKKQIFVGNQTFPGKP
jgi:hypothetical protein